MKKFLMFSIVVLLAVDPIEHPTVGQLVAQLSASVLALSYLLPFVRDCWRILRHAPSSGAAPARAQEDR